MKNEITVDIVLIGKNDDYHQDYLQRTEACLNYNLRAIGKANLLGKIQFLFVDWASQKPLHDSIYIPEKYEKSITFLYVNESSLEQFKLPQKLHPSVAGNVGLYQAAGDFTFWAASDLIATKFEWFKLYQCLGNLDSDFENSKKRILTIERAFLSSDFFTVPRSFHDVDYYLENHSFQTEPVSGAGGGSAFIGGHRDQLIALKGLNEHCSGWGGNDIDLFIRATKNNSAINLTNEFGVKFYKFPYSLKGSRSRNIRSSNRSWVNHIGIENKSVIGKKINVIKNLKKLPEKNLNFPIQESGSPSTWELIQVFISNFNRRSKIKYLFSFKKILEKSDVDCLVFLGNFSELYLNLAIRFFPSSNVLLRYSDKNSADVLGFLDKIRKLDFRSPVHCTREGQEIKTNSASLNFLKGKKIIVFHEENGDVQYAIFDGEVLLPGRTEISDRSHFQKLNIQSRPVFASLILSMWAVTRIYQRISRFFGGAFLK